MEKKICSLHNFMYADRNYEKKIQKWKRAFTEEKRD